MLVHTRYRDQVLVAISGRVRGLEQAFGRFQHRGGHAEPVRQSGSKLEVFEHECQRELHAVVALQQLRRFELRRLAARSSGLDDIQELGGIEASADGDGEAFGEGQIVDADNRIMAELGYRAAAGRTEMDDFLAHRLQNGTNALQQLGFAADHEHERAAYGSGLAARNRAVEEAASGFYRRIRQLPGKGGGDGAVVHQRRAWTDRGENAAFSAVQLPHDVIVAQHRDDDIRFGDSVGGRLRCARAFGGKLLRFGGRPVPYGDRESFFQQVGCHRGTHRSEADKGDRRFCHGDSPTFFVLIRACAAAEAETTFIIP
ncbi:hypothetical protein BN871_EB_00080 [Paenibacillus sp. P22]|nr:hypothetical protein BN871_EB_00080 [Paenibacillus sp. P22]